MADQHSIPTVLESGGSRAGLWLCVELVIIVTVLAFLLVYAGKSNRDMTGAARSMRQAAHSVGKVANRTASIMHAVRLRRASSP